MAQVEIDTTPAGAASNSYVTVAQAKSYLEAHLDEETWESNAEHQETALVAAVRQMNLLVYHGRKYNVSQALVFPREVHVESGNPYVPVEAQNAQIEQAIFLLKQFVQGGASSTRDQLIAAGVTTARIGDIEERYAPGAQANVTLCERARGWLRPFLAGVTAWGY